MAKTSGPMGSRCIVGSVTVGAVGFVQLDVVAPGLEDEDELEIGGGVVELAADAEDPGGFQGVDHLLEALGADEMGRGFRHD